MSVRISLRRRVVLVVACLAATIATVAAPTYAAAVTTSHPWTVQKISPNRKGSLDYVACPSKKTCFATGTLAQSGAKLYHWDGSQWTKVPLPDGVEDEYGPVTCASASLCEVVGWNYWYEYPQWDFYQWNGSHWKKVYGTNDSLWVTDDSCAAPGFCMGVGGEHWTHATQPIYETDERAKIFHIGYAGQFTAVDCVSPKSCIASGFYRAKKGGVKQPFAVRWNGSSFTRISTPKGYISSIDCRTSGFCMATGHGHPSSDKAGWVSPAWVWRGMKAGWSSAPLPVTAHSHPSVNDVTCVSRKACVAVGVDDPPGDVAGRTTIAVWRGSVWHIRATPNLGRSTTRNALTNVSCQSLEYCHAVGYAGKESQQLALSNIPASDS